MSTTVVDNMSTASVDTNCSSYLQLGLEVKLEL